MQLMPDSPHAGDSRTGPRLVRDFVQFRENVRRARIERDADPRSFERFFGQMTDSLEFEAPKRLAAPSLLNDTGTLRRHGFTDWQHVDPRLMTWAARFIEAARRRGIPLYTHSAFRTRDEQAALLKRGVSRAVWPNAPHCKGKAVDIVHAGFHWELTAQEWSFLHKLGLDVLHRYNQTLVLADRLKLVWGGDFKSLYDPAHWEVADWRQAPPPPSAGPPRRLTPRGILALHQYQSPRV